MIDRHSSGTLIYANSAFENVQDGLTIFESGCKIIASNRFFDNGRSGVLVRNSTDIGIFFNVLSDNKHAGVQAYTSNLRSEKQHAHRNFDLDPYADIVAISAVGNWIEGNDVGVHGEALSALMLKFNRFIRQSPKMFRGDWASKISSLFSQYDVDKDGLLLLQRCPTSNYVLREPCTFRRQGYFDGDGQAWLIRRMNDGNACRMPAGGAEGGHA